MTPTLTVNTGSRYPPDIHRVFLLPPHRPTTRKSSARVIRGGGRVAEEVQRRAPAPCVENLVMSVRPGDLGEVMKVSEATATNLVLGAGLGICERCGEVRDAASCCDGCGDALCDGCWGEGDALFCAACWHRRQPAFDDVIVTSGVL